MRRAILSIAIATTAATLALPAGTALAQSETELMNGIGLINYSKPASFKVGSWTKYRVTGRSEKGHTDDYVVTIGIAGEELLWGEPCFWVETATESKAKGSSMIATLMSYSVLDDSLPAANMQFYTRKNITELDEHGRPDEIIARRPPAAVKVRPKEGASVWHTDSLETDTVTIAKGTYVCRHVLIKQHVGSEAERGDSTIYTEIKDERNTHVSRQIPLTGITREDIDYLATRKAWLAGRSSEAPTITVTHATGRAELADFGQDYVGHIIPESKRRSIREQERASARPAPAPVKRKSPPARKSG